VVLASDRNEGKRQKQSNSPMKSEERESRHPLGILLAKNERKSLQASARTIHKIVDNILKEILFLCVLTGVHFKTNNQTVLLLKGGDLRAEANNNKHT